LKRTELREGLKGNEVTEFEYVHKTFQGVLKKEFHFRVVGEEMGLVRKAARVGAACGVGKCSWQGTVPGKRWP